jgi:Na+/melibiose symporter-like transporter
MGSGVPDPFHFSVPDAMTVGMEFVNMPAIDLSKPSEQQTQWSLVLGILIWFLHLNIVNALISVSCKWGGLTLPVDGLSGLQLVIVMISVITILLMLFFIYLPWRNWRSFQTENPTQNPDLMRDTEIYRRPLMAFITMLLNSFLFLYVIATLVPMFSLKVCGQA